MPRRRPRETLSLREAAELAGVQPHALTQAIARGRLRAVKVGPIWTTTAEDVRAYTESRVTWWQDRPDSDTIPE